MIVDRLTGILNQRKIGLSVEGDALRFAENRKGQIVRFAEVPYPDGMSSGTDAFQAFVREQIVAFAGGLRPSNLWLVGNLPGLQIRYLQLPFVQASALGESVYWTFRKDLPFDTDETIFDYGIEIDASESHSGNVHVTAYTAPKEDVNGVCADLPMGSKGGLVAPVYAMRNLLRVANQGGDGEAYVGVFAGQDATSILIMQDGVVQSCRMFKTGMNVLLANLPHPSSESRKSDNVRRLAECLGRTADSQGDRVRHVFDRLAQQIERTISAYANDRQGTRVAGLSLFGGLAGNAEIDALLQERLGLPLLPLRYEVAVGVGAKSDSGIMNRMAMAAGASLCKREETPNLLYTCKQRETIAKQSRVTVALTMAMVAASVIACVVTGGVQRRNQSLRDDVLTQSNRLAVVAVKWDHAELDTMLLSTVANRMAVKKLAIRWLPLAVFQPLAELTPDEIELVEIDFVAGGSAVVLPGKERNYGRGQRPSVIRCKGNVSGDPSLQRSRLASYALRLEDSPLIAYSRVLKLEEIVETGRDTLLFEMELELVFSSKIATLANEGGEG